MTAAADVPTFGTTRPAAEPDPDLAPAGAEPSDLDDLRAELTEDVSGSTTLPVPGRPRYAVTYRLNVTGKDLDAYRKRAKDKTFTDGVNGIRFGAILLAATCTGILRDGRPLELEDEPADVTFASRAFQAIYGVDRAADAVVKFYGLEGNVDAAARAVLDAAGWGDDLEAVSADPS